MARKRNTHRIAFEWSGDLGDLYDYARPPVPRFGRSPLHLDEPITVADNWPQVVPITEVELRAMESHFGQELDEIFGPRA
jgi:hypothetical protein